MITPDEFRARVNDVAPYAAWIYRFMFRPDVFSAQSNCYYILWMDGAMSYRYNRHGRTVISTDLAEFRALVEHAKSLHQQAVRVRQEPAKPDRNAYLHLAEREAYGSPEVYYHPNPLAGGFLFSRVTRANVQDAPVGKYIVALHELTDDHARNLLACVGRPECTRIRAFYASNHDDLFALIARVHGS